MVSLTSQFSVDFSLICNSPHIILKFLFWICYLCFHLVYNVWRFLQNGRTWIRGGGLNKGLKCHSIYLRNWIQYSLSIRNSWFNDLCLFLPPKTQKLLCVICGWFNDLFNWRMYAGRAQQCEFHTVGQRDRILCIDTRAKPLL